MQLNRPFRTRFRYGYTCHGLTLLHTITHWLIMQKAHGRTLPTEVDHSASIACRHRVSDSFHSRFRVLFTFPSRYWFTIGRKHVFSLGRWSFRIPTGFHVSRGTWELYSRSRHSLIYRAITFCGRPSHAVHLKCRLVTSPSVCRRKQ